MSSTITVHGRLTADAQARRTRGGEWLLSMEAEAPTGLLGRIPSARAVLTYGTGDPSAIACRARASQLRRGVRVIIRAGAWWPKNGRIELRDIDHIETPDLHDKHERISP